MLRLIGRGDAGGSTVTEEEVRAMIAEGTDAGVFHQAERDMLEGVIRFADRPVRTIMVPRPEMTWLCADDPLEKTLDIIAASGHSRFPLCAADLDDILGIVLAKDVLELLRRDGRDLRSVAREPLYVSEGIPALKLLELFRSSGLHMALVVDEYGALEGLATPTDILTSIAGELPEFGAGDEPGAVMREDGSWLIDGSLAVDRAAAVLDIKNPPPATTRPSPGWCCRSSAISPSPASAPTPRAGA